MENHMHSAWHALVSLTLQDIVLYSNFKTQGATLQVSRINVLQLLLWLRSGSTSAALASSAVLQQYCCTAAAAVLLHWQYCHSDLNYFLLTTVW
jgi:hypothetical protein